MFEFEKMFFEPQKRALIILENQVPNIPVVFSLIFFLI